MAITGFIFDNGEYFAAHLENGGVRVGMNGLVALDLPAGHRLYDEAATLTAEHADDFITRRVEDGMIPLGSFGGIRAV